MLLAAFQSVVAPYQTSTTGFPEQCTSLFCWIWLLRAPDLLTVDCGLRTFSYLARAYERLRVLLTSA